MKKNNMYRPLNDIKGTKKQIDMYKKIKIGIVAVFLVIASIITVRQFSMISNDAGAEYEKYFNITEAGEVTLKPCYLSIKDIAGRERLSAAEKEEINDMVIKSKMSRSEYVFLCLTQGKVTDEDKASLIPQDNDFKNAYKTVEEVNEAKKALEASTKTTFEESYKSYIKSDPQWDYYLDIIFSEDKTKELPVDIVIPKTINNIIVTSIGSYAFDCGKIESVSIPDTVTLIKSYAFNSCYELTCIKFGKNLKEIEEYAFFNCCNVSDFVYDGEASDWDTIKIGKGNDWVSSEAKESLDTTKEPIQDKDVATTVNDRTKATKPEKPVVTTARANNAKTTKNDVSNAAKQTLTTTVVNTTEKTKK